MPGESDGLSEQAAPEEGASDAQEQSSAGVPQTGGKKGRRRLAWLGGGLLVTVGLAMLVWFTMFGDDGPGWRELRHVERAWKAKPVRNVILIGWDGCLIDDIQKLLAEKKLPNLQRLIDEGGMIDTYITTSKTETKPGWSEILSGYGPETTGVYDNRDRYGAIPKGLTVFERLKTHFGQNDIRVVFFAGKLQNLGNRGPHRVRSDGFRKTWHDETLWTDDEKSGVDIVAHDAEPFFHACKACDIYKVGLGDAPFVGQGLLDALNQMNGQRFFAFAHFWEPDESGHDYGEGTPVYLKVITENDVWLGKVITTLEKLGIYGETAIYLTTDHGFDRGAPSHLFASHTWVVTNDTVKLVAKGDRKDMTPTVLQRFGVDITQFTPPVEGRSLVR